jgi:predicted nucleic acid-binding protein
MTAIANGIVLDASAMVDLLTGGAQAGRVNARVRSATVHVPAHFDAEVLSALGRLCRVGRLPVNEAPALLDAVTRAPFSREGLPGLLSGAWLRRDGLRLVDALYVELADRLAVPLVTTDIGLANAYPAAELP